MSVEIAGQNGVEVEEMDAIPDAGYASTAEEPEVLTPGQIGALARLAEDGLTEDVRLELAEHFGSVEAALAQCRQSFQEEPDDEAASSEAEQDGPPEEELKRDMHSIAVEKAMQELFAVQDRLEAATEDHAEKAEIAKTAKKRVESLQEDLSFATRRLREARNENEPDPGRYPLLDGPKAEINAQFSKPEAIQPLPADDFATHYEDRARFTRFDSLAPKLKPSTLAKLEELGLATIGLYGAKSLAVGEAGADMTTVKGLTRARCEEIADAIGRFNDEVQGEWLAMHPAEAAVEGETED